MFAIIDTGYKMTMASYKSRKAAERKLAALVANGCKGLVIVMVAASS